MPVGTGGSPEVLQTNQTPHAGNRKPQTEEEKAKEAKKKQETEEAAKRAEKSFDMRALYPPKEVLDTATVEQRAQIESFQKKAQDKPISTWNIEELRKSTKEFLDLDDELVRADADPELKKIVDRLLVFNVIELVKRPEFVLTEVPGALMDKIRETNIVVPPEVAAKDISPVGLDVIKAIKTRGKRVKPEIARELWKEYYKDQGKDFASLPWEERQALELAIRQGIAPEYHRTPEEVLRHARIEDDGERVSEAMQFLGRDFTDEQKIALIEAHKIGAVAGVYKLSQEQVAKEARILQAAGFAPWEQRLLMETGFVGVAVPVEAFAGFNPVDYAGTPLEDIARELNNLGTTGLASERKLEDIASRVAAAPGAPDPLRNRLLGEIRNFETARAAVEEAETIARDSRRRGRGDEQELNPYLEHSEERFDAASYAGAGGDVARIAREIEAAFTTGAGDGVNNDFLRNKLTELNNQIPNLEGEAEDQAHKLQRDLYRLKQSLAAKVATKAQKDGRSLYAEIRLTESEKIAIINRAIVSNPNEGQTGWEDWRQLEEEFNRRFSRADVNSSDDWRDALGPGGDTEVREFISTLTNAGENRTKLLNRLLTEDEQERVREAVRRLNQEAKLREYLHSLAYFVNTNAGAEDIIKAAGRFTGGEAEVAFKKRGVPQMLRLYEQAMLEVVAKNGGYLPASAMVNKADGTYGEVEQLVWEQAKKARDMGVLDKGMPDWELRRAIALGRGMGIVTGRFFEIVAMHGLSKDVPLNSWWANGLVKNFAFFQQVGRFNVGQMQNAILGYKLEGGGGPWSTSELKNFENKGKKEMFDILVNDRDDDLLIQMKNPFHIGSIYTQTGWRWKKADNTFASAAAKLKQYDANNPLVGVGLLIETNRGDLHSTTVLSREDREKVDQKYRKNVKTEGERAEVIIEHLIELSAETTPLKLFNNLISLRQDVLRIYYGKDKVDSAGQKYTSEPAQGQIIIESKELQDDISALALVQEQLLQKRKREYMENPQDPHLSTHLDFNSLVTAAEGTEEHNRQVEQAHRVEQLAERIKYEFEEKGHMKKLMFNLYHKGWKVPWVFGTDDVAHEMFDYSAIEGDTFKRRWDADIGPVVQTAGLYGKFITNLTEFKSQGDIVKAMKEIHSTLSSHDASVANEVMRYLAEGVGKFYKKDWTTRLPFGVGKLEGFLGGKASYAQVAFGRGQMAWDELDMQAFLQSVYASGLVEEKQKEELKKRLGAENFQLAWAMLRSGIPLLIFGFIYMMFLEQVEQAKKAA